ncbi:MAG: Carbohydrate family 9 binding domain-like, partial [Paenibacillus sp.]|nr:Carbohydrate family 9 binding domain-like [Paenibacillus sp.]
MQNMDQSRARMNALWKGQPIVASQADRWSIVPRIGEAPRIDGSLDEAAWSEAARMSGFRSFYANEPTGVQTDTEIRLACDDRHLFIGIIGFAGSDGHPAAEKIDILLSTPDQPDRYYNIPIEISRGPRDFTAAYGPGNVVRYYGIAAPRPSSSLIPVRHSSITDLGKPDEGYSMRIDLLQEGRMGSLYWQRPPLPDNAQQVGRWTPERAILTYGSFTEKLLHVEPDEISDCFSLNMMWRTPSNKQIEISEFEFVPAAGIIAFTHPKPLEPGLYQLQITVADNTQAAKMAVLTFDREALIDAGESLYVPPQAAGRIQVTAAAPSEHVTRLLNIIPEQPGVIFGGDPERP